MSGNGKWLSKQGRVPQIVAAQCGILTIILYGKHKVNIKRERENKIKLIMDRQTEQTKKAHVQ